MSLYGEFCLYAMSIQEALDSKNLGGKNGLPHATA